MPESAFQRFLASVAAALRERRFDDAINAIHSVLPLAYEANDPAAIGTLHELRASAFLSRDSGSRADNVEEAVKSYEEALAVGRDEPTGLPGRLSNLAGALAERVYGDKRLNLEHAERLKRKALDSVPRDSPAQFAHMQTGLAVVLARKPLDAQPEALLESRKLCEEALKYRTPERCLVDWAYSAINLGVALQGLIPFGTATRQEAIEVYEAVLAREADLPERSLTSWPKINLAILLIEEARADPARRNSMLTRARSVLTPAAETEPQPFLRARLLTQLSVVEWFAGNVAESDRMLHEATALGSPVDEPSATRANARRLAIGLEERGDWAGAAAAYARALEANDAAIASWSRRDDREAEIAKHSRLHRWAAFAFTRTDRCIEAVLALENGKTRELRNRLDLGERDLRRVAQRDQQLADDFRRVSTALANDPGPDGSNESETLQRLIAAIHRLPQLDRFANRVTFEEIVEVAAPAEPVVYINPTSNGTAVLLVDHNGAVRSEFWAVTAGEIASMLLLGIPEEELKASGGRPEDLRTVARFRAGLIPVAAGDANQRLLRTALSRALPWLSVRIGEPLVRLLESVDARGATVIPSGTAASAPLAAVGRNGNRTSSCLIDAYILRQVPSAASQIAAGRRRMTSNLSAARLVAVADPRGDLRGARAEVSAIARQFPGSVCVLAGDDATRAAVIEQAASATHLHLACHARGGFSGYRDAALKLADGELSLVELATLPLESCRLAVASACQTAVPDSSGLFEESVSIATGLVEAGAMCAVASFWKVDDLATALLMSRFYENHIAHPDLDVGGLLREAQFWLRRSDEDLEAAFRMRLPELVAQWSGIRQTYEHPEYWGAFTAVGL